MSWIGNGMGHGGAFYRFADARCYGDAGTRYIQWVLRGNETTGSDSGMELLQRLVPRLRRRRFCRMLRLLRFSRIGCCTVSIIALGCYLKVFRLLPLYQSRFCIRITTAIPIEGSESRCNRSYAPSISEPPFESVCDPLKVFRRIA